MIIKPKEKLDNSIKEELQKYVYDIVGVIQDVHSELPQGMPEYLYQEALNIALDQSGLNPVKEYQHHPEFRGQKMSSYLKMDIMVPRNRGNINIETCPTGSARIRSKRFSFYNYLRRKKVIWD